MGCHDDSLGSSIQSVSAARSECFPGARFFSDPRRKTGGRCEKSFTCPRCKSHIRTHPDCQALTPGIKTNLRRLHVNLGHPTNDDLTRCLAAGGGTRVAQRAVKCLRCSRCRPQTISHPDRRSTLYDRLFVASCDLVDVRGNRYWWPVAVDQHTDHTVIALCPSHESQAVAKKIFKH